MKDQTTWHNFYPEAHKKRGRYLSILTYHNITSKNNTDNHPDCAIPLMAFKNQMELLKRRGFTCLPLYQMLTTPQSELPKKSFALTFDDGFENFYTTAAPILLEHGFTATVFLVTNMIGGYSDWEGCCNLPLLNWSQIRELQTEGFTFGSHTRTHAQLLFCPPDQIWDELQGSKHTLEDGLQSEVPLIAYPCGESNQAIQQMAAEAGYSAGLGVISGENNTFNIWRWPIKTTEKNLSLYLKTTIHYENYIQLKKWFMEDTLIGQQIREIRRPYLKMAQEHKHAQTLNTNQPLISIVIITWNRREDVLTTIASIYDQNYENFEIIVVDNGSKDQTVEAIQQTFPEVTVIAHQVNKGIGARNDAIRISNGEIIFCLDSDASLGKDSLQNIVSEFKNNSEVGIINSKIVNASTNEIDNIAGWSYSEDTKKDQKKTFETFTFSEGGAAIRKAVFKTSGLFWEPLFFGCEGYEFSLRALETGYKIIYFPKSIIYHRVGENARVSSAERDLRFFKNFLSIYILRFPLWLLLIFLPSKILSMLIRSLKKGYFGQALAAVWAFFISIPKLLKDRIPISRKTARYYYKLQRQHGALSWSLRSWWKSKT